MACQSRPEQGHISDNVYKRMMDGSGASYRARQKRRVTCPLCDSGMAQGYLSRHLRQVHGSSETPVADCPVATMEDVEQSDSYQVSFPSRRPSVPCPVSGCPGRADNRGNIHRHFMYKHPQDRITIMEEGPLPCCELCDMFIPTKALAGGRRSTLCYRRGRELKRKRAAQRESRKADEVVFTVRGIPLELVRAFLYLGCKLSSSDDDWLDVIKNLAKAWQRWARISRVLTCEGSTPRVSAVFYKAVIQTVLLYGYETWVFTPRMLSKLEGFHRQIARRLTGRAPVYLRREGQWQ
jgi:hypothetical protein